MPNLTAVDWLIMLLYFLFALGFGVATDGNMALYTRSLGINANLWRGLALLAFGLGIFFFGRRGQKRHTSQQAFAKEKVERVKSICDLGASGGSNIAKDKHSMIAEAFDSTKKKTRR